jgi:hypothetical protein
MIKAVGLGSVTFSAALVKLGEVVARWTVEPAELVELGEVEVAVDP